MNCHIYNSKMWLGLLWLLTTPALLLGQPRISASVAEFPRDVLKTLYVKNGGSRGYWQAPEFCPVGTYAAGFRIKVRFLFDSLIYQLHVCLITINCILQ